jgi:hypothetical protein
MLNDNMRKFFIEIWFDGLPNKIKLGEVSVYAETEDKALELARAHTDYQISGVDKTHWQVHESVAQYA